MDLLSSFKESLRDRYEIERQIGAGGMATVYLARDLRNQRPVALKLLSPELGAVLGPERFLSEIRVTANLQHPNLLPLFDSGEVDGRLYYVMPYVDGETLRGRLDRERQLPVNEAIHIAVAIASALDYAHRHGVIHRDLKPENILLHDGQPLVADFGIALAVSNAGGERVTQSGLSLGTPQYMSPEQATGDRVIDARTDVYSLGAVLYEMLTGDPPHTGSTAQAIIARLLTETPRSVRGARPSVPEHVEAVVQQALEKLPADRFASARQFADALTHPDTVGLTHARTATIAGRNSKTRRSLALAPPWLIGFTALATVVAISIAVWHFQGNTIADSATPVRFAVAMPEGAEWAEGDAAGVTIAPDGKRIFYLVEREGRTQLYSRSLSDLEGRAISGTEGALGQFVSPDGQWVGFYSGSKLLRIPSAGGTPTLVADVMRPDNAVWLRDNRILLPTSVFTGGRSGLSVIPAGGGKPRAVLKSDSAKGENHATPVVLPDGETVIFNSNGPSGYDDDYLAIGSLKTGEYKALDIIANRAVGYLDGLLLYLREEGTLMAVPVNIRDRRATGDPFPLIEGVAGGWNAAVSENGSLLYVEGQSSSSLVLADEAGAMKPVLPEAGQYVSPRFSPDGRRIAVTMGYGQSDVWIVEIASGTMTRLSSGLADRAAWSPDGRRIAFRSRKAGFGSFLWMPVDRSEGEVSMPFKTPQGSAQEVIISPDGRTALYRVSSKRRGDLFYSTIGGNEAPVPYAVSPADEVSPKFSPDGKWVAYTSDESGMSEVYIRRFPAAGARVQVSTGGGDEPVWAPSGRRLFYRNRKTIVAADLGGTETPEVVSRSIRLRADLSSTDRHANYDVSPDGKHLLVLRTTEQQSRMIWVVNWISELRERTRAEKR